jgi:predicted transcriptional regulator
MSVNNSYIGTKSMMKRTLPRPTDAELEILRVLWQRGPSTVRDVYDTLNDTKATGYTTVLKMLQIMTDKGLVRRDEDQRAHVYEARVPQEQTQQQLVGDLLDRAFNGSASNLVMQALATKKTSTEELNKIREMLDEFERGNK